MRKDEKKLIKKIVILVSLTLTFTISLGCYIHYRKYHFIKKGKLIAKINGFKIYEKDIETRVKTIMENYNIDEHDVNDLTDDEINAVLLEVYLDAKINKLAKKAKINKDNNIKFLAQEYYKRLVREKYLKEKIFKNIKEYEIKKRYDELVEALDGKEERKISHILVDTEEEANRLRSLAILRNNFEEIAKEKSLDKESAVNGGSLGYVLKEEIAVEEFAEIAFMLKVGEISGPVKTSKGWHIIKVEDSRKINIKSYEEAKDEILDKIVTEKFHEFIEIYIKDPKIKIYTEIGKNKEKIDNNNNVEDKEENEELGLKNEETEE